MTPLILAIDDEGHMRNLLERALRQQGRVITAATGQEGINLVEKEEPALVLLDMRLPDMDGIQVLKIIKERSPRIQVIMVTAYGSIDTAILAIKAGAADYLTKPFDIEELRLAVGRNLQLNALVQKVELLQEEVQSRHPEEIIGESEPTKQLRQAVEQISGTQVTVLLTGESGTGKEVVARAIHKSSQRGDKPLVVVNCAALPEPLLESELFGHEKGAFTGAVAKKPGRFELADGGTIFLDEIGEMPPLMQVKLLRVLQDRSFERVGGTKTLKVDVRVIAATNRNLPEAIRLGSFREDLYYRLNVINLHLVPLRERQEDIPALARFFLSKFDVRKKIKGISPEAMKILQAYQWPGNVRELENAIERSLIVASGETILPEHLPFSAAASHRKPFETDGLIIRFPSGGISLDEVEQGLILEALRRTGGNRTGAAKLLGITRSALLYRMEKHGLS
ncbi:MAG: sigma-54-dependent Fis family transcriptional regulator [Syntrophomonadaceae bacterium]|nr:sigma-54-dependent Fis family transcriptional regulator [Syntrophomonadaceae bacterium]